MNEAEHHNMAKLAHAGQILTGIDRAFARRLYIDVHMSAIEEQTGERPYLEKTVAWFAFIVSPATLLASSGVDP